MSNPYAFEAEEYRDALAATPESELPQGCRHTYVLSPLGGVCPHCGDHIWREEL